MLPVKKTSKCRTRTRRAHKHLVAKGLATCPQCQAAKRPHAACGNCGYYSAKVAVPIPSEES